MGALAPLIYGLGAPKAEQTNDNDNNGQDNSPMLTKLEMIQQWSMASASSKSLHGGGNLPPMGVPKVAEIQR